MPRFLRCALLVERIASPARRVDPEHRPGSIVSPLALLVAVIVDVLAVVVLGPWLPDRLARRDAAARLARDALGRRDLLVLALPLFAAFNLRFVVEDHGTDLGRARSDP